MTETIPVPVKTGDLITVTGPGPDGVESVLCSVLAVHIDLRQFYAQSTPPSEQQPLRELISTTMEQMASAMGAVAVIVGTGDLLDLGILWWPEGGWTDMVGTPIEVKEI